MEIHAKNPTFLENIEKGGGSDEQKQWCLWDAGKHFSHFLHRKPTLHFLFLRNLYKHQVQRKAEIFHTSPVPNFIVERGNRPACTFLQWWISSWREGKDRVLYSLGMQNYPVLTSRKHSFRLVGASLKKCWTSSKGIHPSSRTYNINI